MEGRLLAEQIAYYRARASEYDEWFLRQGRYDRGDEHRRLWFDEVAAVEADLFEWTPPATYDFVFFGFWLSHVPHAQFEIFWSMVRRALRPSGKVFFVDTLAAPDATARDQHLETDGIAERRLNDGRTFRIVKIFHEPSGLTARLTDLGWAAAVKATANFFVYGTASR